MSTNLLTEDMMCGVERGWKAFIDMRTLSIGSTHRALSPVETQDEEFLLSGVQFALEQLSERVSLLERDQSEGKCQRDDVEDALQAVDDFRIEVAVKLREKCELLSAAESLSQRLESLVTKVPKPSMLELPEARIVVEMPVTPDASKLDDPRSQLIEVSESTDGVSAEDVEKEYSISVPVTPMPTLQGVSPTAPEASPTVLQANDERTSEELSVLISPQQDDQLDSAKVPHVTELPIIVPDIDPEVPHITELPIIVPEVLMAGHEQTKDDFVSSEATVTTSAGETEKEESSLPSSCREGGSARKTKRSFITEAVSDEGSSSVPSDFRGSIQYNFWLDPQLGKWIEIPLSEVLVFKQYFSVENQKTKVR